MKPQHYSNEEAPQSDKPLHSKPVPPHEFRHKHAGKMCRCIKTCEVCGLVQGMCETRYKP